MTGDRRFIDIRQQVKMAKLVKDGLELSWQDQKDMALTLLQLHAEYECQRAELIRTSPRGLYGPGEWYGFYSDDVPEYPVIIHTHKSGRWPKDE